jgi:hypothetical protein
MEPRAANAGYDAADDELHAVRGQPEPARGAAADVRLRARPAREQGARDRARRGRRLRLQDLPVRRGDRAVVWAGQARGPAHQVDGRAQRVVPRPTRTAATTSARPSSRWTRTATSSALRVKTVANMGAYLSTFATCVPDHPVRHAAGRPVQDAGDLLPK